VGETAIAIGSPLGDFANTATAGIVSALGRQITAGGNSGSAVEQLSGLIQTDAAINPGNSGGALVDAAGDVIGVNTAVSASAQGIGFAIPIDEAKPLIAQAQAGAALARPFLGVRFISLPVPAGSTPPAGAAPGDRGALVAAGPSGEPAISAGSPAAAAGIAAGDRIVSVDGQALDAAHPLDLVLGGMRPGDTVVIEVVRAGATRSVTITLAVRPASA
jgi:S1-C subfamily serine protease